MLKMYHVTTEGDCEGRSTTDLGIWEGDIADIAFHLADKSYYSLNFSPISVKKPTKITSEKVDISSFELRDTIISKEILGTGNFKIKKGDRYNSYTLYLNEEELKNIKKQELLKQKEDIELKLKEL